MIVVQVTLNTPPKTNGLDTQNDELEKVTPFKHGKCWYLKKLMFPKIVVFPAKSTI